MDEPQSRYQCPECDKAILNRKIDKCLYCGAVLPATLLLSPETILELNKQQQKLEEQSRQSTAQPANGDASSNWDVGGIVDAIDIAADVMDIAGDVMSGLGDLLN